MQSADAPPPGPGRPLRETERHELSVGITYRNFRSRLKTTAKLGDLSREGCNILTYERMSPGDTLLLWIKGLDGWVAQVCWVKSGSVGVRFRTPMPQAIVEQYARVFRKVGAPANA